ncbi:MAG: HEAT repeat domain-containing protein [Ktedonobacteraceae bacterium]
MQRGIRPLSQSIMQSNEPDEPRQTSAVCAILNKLGLTKEIDEPQTQSDQTQESAPTSTVNAIMGKLGLARAESEPETDETALACGLTDPAWAVRVATVQKLGNIGKHAPLELLLVALRDDHASVRTAAARALSRNPHQAALPALIASLTDTEWVVRTEVVRALGHLADPEALEALLVTTHDTDAAVRAAALLALSDIGATEARAVLNAALQDEDWSVREAATLALAQLAPSTVIPFALDTCLERGTQTEPLTHTPFTEPLTNTFYTEQDRNGNKRASFLPKYSKSARDTDDTLYWSTRRTNQYMLPPPKKISKYIFMRIAQKSVVLCICIGLICAWLILANRPNMITVRPNTPIAFTTYNAHNSSVEKLAWSPDGRMMASVDSLGMLNIWQVNSGHTIAQYTQAGHILALNWSDASTLLVAYGIVNKSLQVLQLNVGPVLSVHTIFRRSSLPNIPTVAAWSPNGTTLAFNTGQNTDTNEIQLWIINPNIPPHSIPLNPLTESSDHSPLSQLVWSPNGNQLATLSQRGQLRIWDISTGTMLTTLPNEQQITSVTWISCPLNNYGLIFAQAQNMLLEWCPQQKDQTPVPFLTGQTNIPLVQTYNLSSTSNLSVGTIAVSPQSTQILLATSDGFVQVRNATTGRMLYVYTGHSAPVNAIIWSPDGHSIATASMDTTVQVWQLI